MFLSKTTSESINRLLIDPPNAVIISGVKGMGKSYVALQIAKRMLGSSKNWKTNVHILESDSNSIGIEQVREFQKYIITKKTDPGINRVLLIHDADKLTIESQNALLKTLEEPPKGTILILTTSNTTLLLPTIRSRSQKITLHPLNDMQIAELTGLKSGDRIVHLANGRPGLAVELSKGDNEAIENNIEIAKQFVSMSVGGRSIYLSNIKKSEHAKELIDGMLIIAPAALNTSMDVNSLSKTNTWLRLSRAAFDAKSSLEASVNLKLVTLKFLTDSWV